MKNVHQQAGAVVVEFAIVIIPLLVLAAGVSEFGRAVYQYNALAKSVRDGARHLSQYAPGDLARIEEAKCLVRTGLYQCVDSDKSLVPGVTKDMVQIADRSNSTAHNLQATGRGTVNLVSVSIEGYQFTHIFPIWGDSMLFSDIESTMVQVL